MILTGLSTLHILSYSLTLTLTLFDGQYEEVSHGTALGHDVTVYLTKEREEEEGKKRERERGERGGLLFKRYFHPMTLYKCRIPSQGQSPSYIHTCSCITHSREQLYLS